MLLYKVLVSGVLMNDSETTQVGAGGDRQTRPSKRKVINSGEGVWDDGGTNGWAELAPFNPL